jgi:hypothetical protein
LFETERIVIILIPMVVKLMRVQRQVVVQVVVQQVQVVLMIVHVVVAIHLIVKHLNVPIVVNVVVHLEWVSMMKKMMKKMDPLLMILGRMNGLLTHATVHVVRDMSIGITTPALVPGMSYIMIMIMLCNDDVDATNKKVSVKVVNVIVHNHQ